MSCPLKDRAALARLLGGTCGDEERRKMQEHLRTSCETCLELFEQADALEILGAIGGQAAALSDAEEERIFRRAHEGAPARRAQVTRPARWWRPAVGAVLAAAAALLFAVRAPRPGALAVPGVQREKGSSLSVTDVSLRLYAMTRDAVARTPRPLGPSARVEAGEVLLFRYRLNEPAHLYLWLERGPQGAPLLLWSSSGPASAGEEEVAAAGSALAIDPERLDLGTRQAALHFVLVASDAPLEPPRLDCADCARASRAVSLTPTP
jgi:hypothetical protein